MIMFIYKESSNRITDLTVTRAADDSSLCQHLMSLQEQNNKTITCPSLSQTMSTMSSVSITESLDIRTRSPLTLRPFLPNALSVLGKDKTTDGPGSEMFAKVIKFG